MLKDIEKHKNDNLGGIFSLQIIPIEHVSSIPEAIDGIIHKALIPTADGRWLSVYATEYTISFKENQEDSDHGDYYSKVITGKVPKNRPLITDQFTQFKNRKFICLITYNNGTSVLVGNLDEPMMFKSAHSSKEQMGDRNETDFTFSGKGLNKSPFYYI